MTKNELINERWKAFFQERYDPDNMDVSSFKFQTELHPKIWMRQGQLDPEIRTRLLKIANDFFKSLKLPNVNIIDVNFTGSLANYNWSNYSDIDLHIVVDFKQVDENIKLVKDFFNSKKADWNNLHNIEIFGFEVEVYIQDANEPHVSTGIYSLMNNQWTERPDPKQPDIDWQQVKVKAASVVDQIDRAQEQYYTDDFDGAYAIASQLRDKVKKLRKCGLESAQAENSVENLAFKVLRRNGYLKKLLTLRINSYDKIMSVDDKQDKRLGTTVYEQTEPYQRKARAKHKRNRLTTKGKKVKEPPYVISPPSRRGKSAPPLGESEELLTEATPKALKSIYTGPKYADKPQLAKSMIKAIDAFSEEDKVPNKYLGYIVKKWQEYTEENEEFLAPGEILHQEIEEDRKSFANLVKRYDQVLRAGKVKIAKESGFYDIIYRRWQTWIEDPSFYKTEGRKSHVNVFDITSFMKAALWELEEVVDIAEETKTKTEMKNIESEKTEFIYQDETYEIRAPKTHEASCVIGTRAWCISMGSPDQWDAHVEQGIFFVFVKNHTLKPIPQEPKIDSSLIAVGFKKDDPNFILVHDAQNRLIEGEDIKRLVGYSSWMPIVQKWASEKTKSPIIKVGDLVEIARVGKADRYSSLLGLWAVVEDIDYDPTSSNEDYITIKWAATPGRWRQWGLENVKKNDDSRTRNNNFFRDQLELIMGRDEFEKNYGAAEGEPIVLEPEDDDGDYDLQESKLNYRSPRWSWVTR
tara:strand:+ start:5854 stop:8103 length:2250 start_codon:yes stop_codon:yes gene_type:complete